MLVLQGVPFTKEELRDFQRVFPESLAAALLNRLMQKQTDRALKILVDPTSSLEQIRYGQGVNDGLALLYADIKAVMMADLAVLTEEEKKVVSEEDREGTEEEDVDLNF